MMIEMQEFGIDPGCSGQHRRAALCYGVRCSIAHWQARRSSSLRKPTCSVRAKCLNIAPAVLIGDAACSRRARHGRGELGQERAEAGLSEQPPKILVVLDDSSSGRAFRGNLSWKPELIAAIASKVAMEACLY